MGADLQQLLRIGRGCRITSEAQRRCGPPQQRGVPGGVGRRQQHQLAGSAPAAPAPAAGSGPGAGPERRQTRRGRTGEATGQLGFAHPCGQLQQPQRIPPVSATIRSRTRSSRWPGTAAVSRRPRVLVGQPVEGQRRQAGKQPLVGRLPDREQEQHRLSQQPPSDEPEHLGRGFVQPLGVIDQADQRPRGGILGQQAQHRQAHDEPVRSRLRRQPERHPQRPLLRLRQRGQAAQHRPAELVQRRERQLHLGFHTGDLNERQPDAWRAQ